MRLHRIVILDGRRVGLVDDDCCFGEGRCGISAVRGAASALGGAGVLEQGVEVELGGLGVVIDLEEGGGIAGLIE